MRNAPKNQNGGGGMRVLTVLLCAVIAFGSGFGGALCALSFRETAPTEENTVTNAPSQNDLLNENPQGLLDKSQSNASEYGSAGEDVFSVSQVAEKVQDTVVVIEASVMTSSFFGETGTSVSRGSGVVISADGYILTCNHVVENANEVTVTLNNGEKYQASLVGSDATSDLAVLRINPTKALAYAEQGCSSDLVIGERVVAIGNPLGTLEGTVTDGIISATERSILTSDGTTMTLLQTNAAINSGNSGGGLFNLDGKLIGIVNAKYAAEGVEGLAFAIPIDSAYQVELDLIEFGYVRGIVDHGLEVLDINSSNINRYHYYYGIDTIGVYVVESVYCQDLKNKDRIVSINGTAITTSAEMEVLISACKVGDTLTIVASRDGEEFTTTLVLQEYVPEGVADRLN
ncbi:MAG: trypsin-like peptidase domain-containing protein [Clostridia bacterium]|nr:trypsin-like peptidase domain-containing protein [Clostridia bacterium]